MGYKMELLIITGLSGAGKSVAMKTFEDLGYYCMDNLPPALLPEFADLFLKSEQKNSKIAVVVDVRGGKFFDSLFESLEKLTDKGIDYRILFLDASNQSLVKRYKESRRTHPLNQRGSIVDGINLEREILKDIRNRSYYIIDTSNLTNKMLDNNLRNIFVKGEVKRDLNIVISSFGFKNGILLDADLVFDVRFLPNPYYIPELKKIPGIFDVTKEYIFKWPQTNIFLNKLESMLEFLIPYYIDEGKTQLIIGIGCTGGFHRSVAISEKLGEMLMEKNHEVIVSHRDLER